MKSKLRFFSRGPLAGFLLAMGLLAACGGNSEVASGVGSGGTGAYTAGPISGFGSIYVNGVEFDDSQAQLRDEEGRPISPAADSLRLGMTVGVDSPVFQGGAQPQAVAATIRVSSDLVGVVSSVDAVAGRFTVLGQTVQVAVTTALDTRFAGGVAAMLGQTVQVYALPGAAGGLYVATRVEPAVASTYKLRGVAGAIDLAAKTVRVGSATLIAPSGLPSTLREGSVFRAYLLAQPDGSGRWVVSAWGSDSHVSKEGRQAKLEGLITWFTDAQHFSVDGVQVDASGLQPNGAVRAGARIQVEGQFVGSTLRATELELKGDDQDSLRDFEVKGAISALNTAARTMVVKGQSIDISKAQFEEGSFSDLVVGLDVEVKAVLSPDRTSLVATRVKIRRR